MKLFRNLLLTTALLTGQAYAVQKGLNFKYKQGEGTLQTVNKVEKLSVISNLNVPKGIVMSLMDVDPEYAEYSALNADFGTDLYQIIYNINKSSNLKNTTSGVDQDIDFVVAGSAKRIEVLQKKIEDRLGTSDALEYFNFVVTDNLVEGGLNLDRWMQDWGEFLGYGRNADGEMVSGVYYVNRGRGLERIVQEIAMMLDLPFIRSESNTGSGGNYGGNIEMTPDGTLYFGNTMDWKQENQLVGKNGRSNAAKLDTSWLAVGHVDEHMSVIPAKAQLEYPADYTGPRANYGLVVADPIWGLKTIYEYTGSQKYITYLAEYLPEYNKMIEIPTNHESYFGITELKKAIKWYITDESNFALKDTTKKKFTSGFELNRSVSKKCTKETKLNARYCDLIAYNIYVSRIIAQNQDIMVSSTATTNDNIIKVPQIYREDYYQGKPAGGISFLPGTANMLVMRDHLIVPEVTFDGFQNIIHDVLGKAIGSNDRVHFIKEKAEYHDLYGEVHCGTNVMRELDLMIPNL